MKYSGKRPKPLPPPPPPTKLVSYAYEYYNEVLYFSLFKLEIKGDLQTICRFSYRKVYKLITLGTKFKNLLSLGGGKSYVIILVQCNLFMIFQSIVIPVRYQNKSPNFECNVIDLCTT